MDRTYKQHDFEQLIHFDWDSFENLYTVDDAGIWLFKRNAPEFSWLSDEERDLFLSHPDKDANKPVLPFPFTLSEFLKFATLPAFDLREFYTFADNTIDEKAIERLGLTHTPAWELARALMFGERPKQSSPEVKQGGIVSADAKWMVTATESGGLNYEKTVHAQNTSTVPRFSMTKRALIGAHKHEWPTIERDLLDASVNGLGAAKAGPRGWWEAQAMEWARAKGKLESGAKPAVELARTINSIASIPGRRYKPKG